MGSEKNSEEVIILSDDDDDDEDKVNDLSCIVVEVESLKKPDFISSPSTPDEDLVVTFSRRADVLPHARYDCPVHPFTATDCEIGVPAASNKLICDQCFCYICDKLASLCSMWCILGACHCNSHKKSIFWNNIRNVVLLGELNEFNLTLSEVDSHLRRAGTLLQTFRKEFSVLFSHFVLGPAVHQTHHQSPQGFVQDYTSIFQFISSFLDTADEQDGRAAAIMHLGAAEEFNKHFQLLWPTQSSHIAKVADARMVLLQRVTNTVQRHMVMGVFDSQFIQKIQDFYQKRVFLPFEMRFMKNSLCVRPWDDVLLVSVMKGQNVTGVRRDKGRKDVLAEQISVVLLRTELLQRQHRYRELCRYLQIVKTSDSTLFQPIQDLVPFFMCLMGDFTLPLINLFSLVNAPASRLTPQLFLFYFRVFSTATAPTLLVTRPEQLCRSDATWDPIKDAVPLRRAELVRFALKAQRFAPSVHTDSECWTSLLTIVNSPGDSLTALPAPSPEFLHEAGDVVKSLLNQQDSNMLIPRTFLEVYPDQALLLLVTEALGFRILNAPLSPALPVLNTYKENLWAFKWLCDSLATNEERITSFLQEVTLEAANTEGSPLAVSLNLTHLKASSQIQP